jgi:hypothetical protein
VAVVRGVAVAIVHVVGMLAVRLTRVPARWAMRVLVFAVLLVVVHLLLPGASILHVVCHL